MSSQRTGTKAGTLAAVALVVFGTHSPARPDEDLAELLEGLIEAADELESFRATYAARADGLGIELVYRAPDDARIVADMGDGQVELISSDGVFHFSVDDWVAHVDAFGLLSGIQDQLAEAAPDVFDEASGDSATRIDFWLDADEEGKPKLNVALSIRQLSGSALS